MKFLTKFLVGFVVVLLGVSCSQKPAKIENHSRSYYSKNTKFNARKSRAARSRSASNSSEIRVRTGDTLYSVSKRYNVSLHDLIRSNNLRPPYILKGGTRLKIPVPEYHKVLEGDTLYAISRKYNMKLDDLIAVNNLKAPYNVWSGQKIRISKSKRRARKSTPSRKRNNNQGVIAKTLSKFNRFQMPVEGVIISRFGPKEGGLHNDGINIRAASGTPVVAAEDGVVAYVGNELKGYGNLIIVKHSGSWITAYAHLSASKVKRGQRVDQGQKIGLVGSTGNVTSPQLYFGLRKGRDAVNPQKHLKK